MRVIVGNQLAIVVTLTGCTGSHTDAKGNSLLQYQHEHGRQHARTVATRRIEHRNIVNSQRLRRNGILTFGVVTCTLDVHARTKASGLDHGGLIDGLIGHISDMSQ